MSNWAKIFLRWPPESAREHQTWSKKKAKTISFSSQSRNLECVESVNSLWALIDTEEDTIQRAKSISVKAVFAILTIERIQRRATNYILNNPKRPDPRHVDYKDRLLELNLLPLTYRRKIHDIQTFLQIWNGQNKLGLDKILRFLEPSQGIATRAMAAGLTLHYVKTRFIATAHFYPYRQSDSVWFGITYPKTSDSNSSSWLTPTKSSGCFYSITSRGSRTPSIPTIHALGLLTVTVLDADRHSHKFHLSSL